MACSHISPESFIAILVGLIAICTTIVVGIHICDHFTIRKIMGQMDEIDKKSDSIVMTQKITGYDVQVTRALSVLSIQPYLAAKIFTELIFEAINDENALYCKKGIKGLEQVGNFIRHKKDKYPSYTNDVKEFKKYQDFINENYKNLAYLESNQIYKTFKREVSDAINRILDNSD